MTLRVLLTLLAFGGSLISCGGQGGPTGGADTVTVSDGASDDGSGGAVLDVATDAPAPDVAPVTSDLLPVAPDGAERTLDAPVTADLETADTAVVTGTETATAWGTITGACGAISAAVQQPGAALLHTTYTFADGASFDPAGLSGQTLKRYEEPNAGGSSKCSEVMSMQLLMDCEGAVVTKTETEVVYDTEGKITDYLIEVGGVTGGVSVTRAYLGPGVEVYTVEDATDLLEKKLAGIEEALNNVSTDDTWQKSIVHIWTLYPEWAETVQVAWAALEPATQGSTLVLVTVEEGSDYIVTDACDD
ncbi:MAG: hypothetical protein QF464_06480 [Myxococcota bacterium]|nr:hypothetical protein [Myxococcota bacterium]